MKTRLLKKYRKLSKKYIRIARQESDYPNFFIYRFIKWGLFSMVPWQRLAVIRPGNLNGLGTEIDLRNQRNLWIMKQVAKERTKYESYGISDDIIKKYYKNDKKRKSRKES